MTEFKKSVDYFYRLIDDQGIIQFSREKEKDYKFGYAIEDQARALVLAVQLGDEKSTQKLLQIILRAKDDRGVKMLWDRKGVFLPNIDDFGEASSEVVWALGEYEKIPKAENVYEVKKFLSEGVINCPYPRPWSYAILGFNKNEQVAERLAKKILNLYTKNSAVEWPWFENKLIYGNALLPWAMFRAFRLTGNNEYLHTAEKSFEFLTKSLHKDGKPIVVGNKGWWQKGKNMARFDQQPIDVSYMCLCANEALTITGEEKYVRTIRFYASWFEGNNLLNTPLIGANGACADGLNADGPNKNSGAESNICYLLAQIVRNKL